VIFKDAVVKAAANGRIWDAPSQTPWYHYTSNSVIHQTWYDDGESMALKYRFVKSRNLQGTMIWALGYDNGRNELWNAIEAELGLPVVTDGGSPDAGGSDAGSGDAGSPDAGSDAGSPDAGVADGGTGNPPPDAGPDAGPDPQPVVPAGGCGSSSAGLGALLAALAALAMRRRRIG